MVSLDEAIGEFVADLQVAGRARWTVKKHELELCRLGRWCADRGVEWHQLARRDIHAYVRTRSHLGYSSRANMICSIRRFLAWGVDQEYIALSPATDLKTPRRPHPLPRSLTLGQVRQVVNYVQACEGRRARRDEALLLTGIYAGLRACELAPLRWSSIDLAERVINIRLSKMGRGRSVPIHPELAIVLERWRLEQAGADDWPVFSLHNKAFKPTRVGKIARTISKACGVHFTAHMLRHTFATWALRRSGNLYAVSKSLGHAQLAQTEIYVSADVESLRAAVASLPNLQAW